MIYVIMVAKVQKVCELRAICVLKNADTIIHARPATHGSGAGGMGTDGALAIRPRACLS